ncbi:hypothetical protein F4778DRAFT_717464 [Xylariomycetidae sp. FL2044]|nr:hypothetical protein F4778DRAFT_717464 [Xylariomycetidae sp. FL2044]
MSTTQRPAAPSEHRWPHFYRSPDYHWQHVRQQDGRTMYYRPLGLVESSFDSDGRYHEGRADIHSFLELEIRSALTDADLRERILTAWTCLRCEHLLLQAKAQSIRDLALPHADDLPPEMDVQFVVHPGTTVEEAIEDARRQLVFLDDFYQTVDPKDFWLHVQNTGRVLNPEVALAKFFVHPLIPSSDGHSTLRLTMIGSHQIWDGLTAFVWNRNLIHLLNLSTSDLRDRLTRALQPSTILDRLPLPQEALNPPVRGSRAKQRWFWLLTRILRHVKKPLPTGFPNPLSRSTPLFQSPKSPPSSIPPTYSQVLNYNASSPQPSVPMRASMSLRNTARLHKICRSAGLGIGAGLSALCGLIMMEFYERLHPTLPLSDRRPLIVGFPLDARAFLSYPSGAGPQEPNCVTLAFCEGIVLPFLSAALPVEGRLRLLAKQADRQMRRYQKRRLKLDETDVQYMGPRGAGRLMQLQYLDRIERVDSQLPPEDPDAPGGKRRIGGGAQGAYPAATSGSRCTYNISSVGRRDAILGRGMYDVGSTPIGYGEGDKDFVADFRDMQFGVRPREGECLIACVGTEDGLLALGSVDGTTIDPALVEQWCQRFEHILDDGDDVGVEKQGAKL